MAQDRRVIAIQMLPKAYDEIQRLNFTSCQFLYQRPATERLASGAEASAPSSSSLFSLSPSQVTSLSISMCSSDASASRLYSSFLTRKS